MIALTPAEEIAFAWLDWELDLCDPEQATIIDTLARIVQGERPSRRDVNCAWANLLAKYWGEAQKDDPDQESCRNQAALLRLMAAYLRVEQGASWAAARRDVEGEIGGPQGS